MTSKKLWLWGPGLIILLLIIAVGSYMWSDRKPTSRVDQISYSIGANFGKSLRAQKLELSGSALARGIRDAMDSDQLQLSEDEMQLALSQLNEDRNKQTAHCATQRHHQVKPGRVFRAGLGEREFTVANHAEKKQEPRICDDLEEEILDGSLFRQYHGQGRQGDNTQRTAVPARAGETQNKTHQVNRQRQDPQQGNYGHFLTKIVRHRKKHRRRQRW